ncbi:MAG: radical SAM protein [Elusimicrobiota bacterium]|nr:radical SAM protein [Elusimicrobiota bacterium]
MSSYKYLFGPVLSRRLGISLGVDPVPFKTCTYNCVYCECGATKEKSTVRKEYIKIAPILEELDDFLSKGPEIDYVTFSGGGEPTLNSGIGRVVKFIKERYSQYKTALLTNGSLLYRDDVIEDIKDCDLVIPSVDAVNEETFKEINDPAEGFRQARVIEGIKKLRLKSSADIWVEIFIVPGINDTPEEINKLKESLLNVKPEKIQLNCLDRPGTRQWVETPTAEKLKEIQRELQPLNAEIIGRYKGKKKEATGLTADLEKRILNLVKRRPCTAENISNSFGVKIGTVRRNLRKLENCGKITWQKKRKGRIL